MTFNISSYPRLHLPSLATNTLDRQSGTEVPGRLSLDQCDAYGQLSVSLTMM